MGQYDEDDETEQEVYVQDKYKRNYDYLYDMRRFYALLHKGLEFLPEETLRYYLNSQDIVGVAQPLSKDINVYEFKNEKVAI